MASSSGAGAAPPLRLFFALWPDDAVREVLAAAVTRLHRECGGRPTAAGNLHVTLAFLGSVAQHRLGDFTAVADSLRGDAFDLALDTVSYWRHNRIVWAGASETPDALAGLAEALRLALRGIGWPVDERAYAAHVTLLRDARRGPATHASALPLWRVRDFALVRSMPHADGVRYTPLQRWRLGV